MKKATKKTNTPTSTVVTNLDAVKEKTPKDPPVKRQSVFDLRLTRFELLHLRDLMGILLPPDGAQTISQALACVEERSLIESILWEKLSKLCSEAKLPLDEEAPDFIVSTAGPTPLGIFQVNHDLASNKSPEAGYLSSAESQEEE